MVEIPTPSLRHSFTLEVELGPPIELGQGLAGQRRIIPIVGGRALCLGQPHVVYLCGGGLERLSG